MEDNYQFYLMKIALTKHLFMKKIARKIIEFVYPDFLFASKSYSQDGEDMITKSFYEGQKNYKGFYVDVGAYHPIRFSNTFYFYKKGWHGMNIEPTPDMFKRFPRMRKRDINLNIAISDQPGSLDFYLFNEPGLNSFDEKLSLSRVDEKYKIIGKKEIKLEKLEKILDDHLPKDQHIDFISIDVEGLDLNVLKSNNWEKYRPSHILVETHMHLENATDNEIYKFLVSKGYKLSGQTLRTSAFSLVD